MNESECQAELLKVPLRPQDFVLLFAVSPPDYMIFRGPNHHPTGWRAKLWESKNERGWRKMEESLKSEHGLTRVKFPAPCPNC